MKSATNKVPKTPLYFLFTYLLLIISMVGGCSSVPRKTSPELQVVSHVDLERYLGKWYEIARYPHSFEEGCFGTTAFYEQMEEGSIKVTNQCRQGGPEGKWKEAVGHASVADNRTNAKLKVQFFWPFTGNYWIIDLDEDYRHAIVSEPNRQYLWILSRPPQMAPQTFERLKEKIREKGFDLSYLIKTPQ